MEDYTLLTFRQISKLVKRQIYTHKNKPRKARPQDEKMQSVLRLVNRRSLCSLSLEDLYKGTDAEFTPKQRIELRLTETYPEFFGRMLFRFMYFVLYHVIHDNVTISLPSVGFYSDIHVRTVMGDEYVLARQDGEFMSVDPVNSNFSACLATLFTYNKRDSTESHHTDILSDMQNELDSLTDSGKKYYETQPLTLDDFLLDFQELYPSIDYGVLKNIIVYGLRRLTSYARHGGDVLLSHGNKWLYFTHVRYGCDKGSVKYCRRQLLKKTACLLKGCKWDGYYYFGITQAEYKYYFKEHKNIRGEYYFMYPKILFKYPLMAELYYIKSRHIVRCKSSQDFGNTRYIRTYISLPDIEYYQHKSRTAIERLLDNGIWQRKLQ